MSGAGSVLSPDICGHVETHLVLLLYCFIKADEQTITAEQTDIMCAFCFQIKNYVDGIDIYLDLTDVDTNTTGSLLHSIYFL